MWLFTRYGFFSVVADGTDRTYVLIRSRSAQHLQNLREGFPSLLEGYKTLHTPSAAYHYRLRVTRMAWIGLGADLAADVRYTNVRTIVAKNVMTLGGGYVRAMHAVWTLVEMAYERKTG